VFTKTLPFFIARHKIYAGGMELANNQPELPLLQSPACDIIMINGRCTLRREGEARMVCVAGSAMHHWMAGDPMAERYAMVSLVQSGYAD